ncbi:hypothetical protein ABZ554_46790 [Streptomyces sp. NPDC020125]
MSSGRGGRFSGAHRPDRYTFALATDTAELEQATHDLARTASTQEAGA